MQVRRVRSAGGGRAAGGGGIGTYHGRLVLTADRLVHITDTSDNKGNLEVCPLHLGVAGNDRPPLQMPKVHSWPLENHVRDKYQPGLSLDDDGGDGAINFPAHRQGGVWAKMGPYIQ